MKRLVQKRILTFVLTAVMAVFLISCPVFAGNTAAPEVKIGTDATHPARKTALTASHFLWESSTATGNSGTTGNPKAMSNQTIAEIADQTYTGQAITPEITVKSGSDTLVEGTDYTVAYSNNVYVGTATVTISGMGSFVSTVEKTFKILPRSIEGATVTLRGGALVADGGTLKQEIEQVELDGTPLYIASDYVIEKNGNVVENAVAGDYTFTISGQDNYTGSVEVPFTVLAAQDENTTAAPITEEVTSRYGKGTVTIKTVAVDGAPQFSFLMSSNDLIAAVVTADDLRMVEEGSTLNVWLEASPNNNVNAEVKQAIEAAIGQKTVSCYLDVSLCKQLTEASGKVIRETKAEDANEGKAVLIGVAISDELAAGNADFGIVRYHNGQADILDSAYAEDNQALYFVTSRFSDYAIIMAPKTASSAQTAANETTASSGAEVSSHSGLLIFLLPAALILVVGAGSLLVAAKKKKKEKESREKKENADK